MSSLLPYLTPLRSIDPNDTSFADLDSLSNIVDNKKIILLGEQSHGDGAVFLAKTRLIKFLHEKKGYDVLAMESGFFDCEFAGNRIAEGNPVRPEMEKSVFDLWTSSEQFRPLMEYIASTQHTARPLRLSGFDLQFTGKYGHDSSSILLRRYLQQRIKISGTDSFVVRTADMVSKRSTKLQLYSDSMQNLFLSSVDTMREKIKKLHDQESLFWLQVLQNIGVYAEFTWKVDWNKPDPRYFNLRDRQMASNVLWLSTVRYPGQKIIVWGASSHISRNRQLILHQKNLDSSMIPMGDYVWRQMKDSILALGFTSYDGTMGLRRGKRTILAKARNGSLEDIISHTGFEYAFLNLNGLPKDHWMSDHFNARPFGYTMMDAYWSQMLDGMIYIKTMTPSTETEN